MTVKYNTMNVGVLIVGQEQDLENLGCLVGLLNVENLDTIITQAIQNGSHVEGRQIFPQHTLWV